MLTAPISHGLLGTGAYGAKGRVPDALFAYGGEVVARPSMAGRYFVPDLEMGFEGIDLEYDFSPLGVRRRDIQLNFDKVLGGITVRMIVPHEVAERALLHTQLAPAANLRALLDAVHQAMQETAPTVDQLTREAVQVMSEAGVDPANPPSAIVDRGGESPARNLDPQTIADKNASLELEPLSDDAAVAEVATRLSQLTGLSDRELGQLFPGQVSREHFQRWRAGKSDNPTAANRRRMWFLLRLFERLAAGAVAVREWIRNPTVLDERTPYDLLRVGRFDEVENIVAQLLPVPEPGEIMGDEGRLASVEQGPAVFASRPDESVDFLYKESDGWIEIEEDIDDEMDNA